MMQGTGYRIWTWMIWGCLLGSAPLLAQPAGTLPDSSEAGDFYGLPLSALDSPGIRQRGGALDGVLNGQVSVASLKSLSRRNSPGIITVITEEEIRNSGARSLIDVLRLVPGVTFGLEGQGRVGIGLRGNWANEGKVLLVIDEQEMNDIYSAGLAFGNHYPVEMIKRIELIRGPGAAIYGGFAELSVIKVTTYNGEQVSGLSAGYSQGWFDGNSARINRRFYVGKNWRNFTINWSAYRGVAQRSDREAFGFFPANQVDSVRGRGAYVPLDGQSRIGPFFSNLFLRWGKFSYRNITDFYDVTDVSYLDSSLTRPVSRGVRTTYNEFALNLPLGEKATLKPSYTTILQFPQFSGLADSLLIGQEENLITRNRLKLHLDWEPTHRINLQLGGEYFNDFAEADLDRQLLLVGDQDQSYNNFAGYAQGIFHTPGDFYLTAGLRYDYNSAFGEALVPRLGLTRKFNRFHFKLLASRSFRAPSVGNFALSYTGNFSVAADSLSITLTDRFLRPERSQVFELELGYQLSQNLFLTANLFDIAQRDPIVFSWFQDESIRNLFDEEAGIFVYRNGEGSGSRGMELDLRWRSDWGYLNANYSYYTSAGKPQIFEHSVRSFAWNPNERQLVNRGALLGLPQHRANVQACAYLTQKISLTFTGSYLGERYGYDVLLDSADPLGTSRILKKEAPTLLGNVFFRWQGFLFRGLDLGAGVYDLFDQGITYYQPFFGLEAPLPGPSREFLISASFDLNFKDKRPDRNRR